MCQAEHRHSEVELVKKCGDFLFKVWCKKWNCRGVEQVYVGHYLPGVGCDVCVGAAVWWDPGGLAEV